MTEPEAAAYLGLRETTLRVYRGEHRGPRHTVRDLGGPRPRIWYEQEDIDSWVAARKRRAAERMTEQAKLVRWNRPRGDRAPNAHVEPRFRELARHYAEAEARVEERMQLWRAAVVEPHVACIRLRRDLAEVGFGLTRLEQRLLRILADLEPAAIDKRAKAAANWAAEHDLQTAINRHLAMVEHHQRRREVRL